MCFFQYLIYPVFPVTTKYMGLDLIQLPKKKTLACSAGFGVANIVLQIFYFEQNNFFMEAQRPYGRHENGAVYRKELTVKK